MKDIEKKFKKKKNPEPPALTELYVRFNLAHEKLQHIDRRLKNANGLEEYDKIMIERIKAYNEYSELKSEVKKAEARAPQKKLSDQSWER